jgi:hypothetical protein
LELEQAEGTAGKLTKENRFVAADWSGLRPLSEIGFSTSDCQRRLLTFIIPAGAEGFLGLAGSMSGTEI